MGAKSYNTTEMRNGAKTIAGIQLEEPSAFQAQSQINLLTNFNGKTPAQMHHQQFSEETPSKAQMCSRENAHLPTCRCVNKVAGNTTTYLNSQTCNPLRRMLNKAVLTEMARGTDQLT